MAEYYTFPSDFKFGVATAAYQIEGAWNIGGKSESVWDYQTHEFSEHISDKSSGDIACDSYNNISQDVKMIKSLKVHFYRFSISWCRILPTGFTNIVNEEGVCYYSNLIDKLLKYNIQPMITLFHWDLPQSLQKIGGWANPLMADYFAEYARCCFNLFGSRVKYWITINEPLQIAQFGYGSDRLAPYLNLQGTGSYLAGHTLLLAHAKAYHIYHKEFGLQQKGKVGISIESCWYEPFVSCKDDYWASDAGLQWNAGWFANPIFSKNGDYPALMRQRIDRLSKMQGYPTSRLPHFTEEEISLLCGSSDFFGLNHYTTYYATKQSCGYIPSNENDSGIKIFQDDAWPRTAREVFRVVPWGLRKLLNWIKLSYGNPEVIITENGYAGHQKEKFDDIERIEYMKGYLREILKAIHEDKCNVTGYTAWSLMDNFEWSDGYQMRFGLYYVDFDDPQRSRTPKNSVTAYRDIILSRSVD